MSRSRFAGRLLGGIARQNKRSPGKEVKSGADKASNCCKVTHNRKKLALGVAFEGRIQLVGIAELALDALSVETKVRAIKMARSGMVMA